MARPAAGLRELLALLFGLSYRSSAAGCSRKCLGYGGGKFPTCRDQASWKLAATTPSAHLEPHLFWAKSIANLLNTTTPMASRKSTKYRNTLRTRHGFWAACHWR